MHSAIFDADIKDGGEVLVAITALVTEGRIPGKLSSKTKGFYEGPHSPLNKTAKDHKCDLSNVLCSSFGNVRAQILDLWTTNISICLEVLLACSCKSTVAPTLSPDDNTFLLEQWSITITQRRTSDPLFFNFIQLLNAIRSQLYFSQLTAWLTIQDEASPILITGSNLRYRLAIPSETTEFTSAPQKHEFPLTDLGNGNTACVSFLTAKRMSAVPGFACQGCAPRGMLDDRMHTMCQLKGKHRCEDFEENIDEIKCSMYKRRCQKEPTAPSTSTVRRNLINKDLMVVEVQQDGGKMLLDAIERVKSTKDKKNASCSDNGCDKSESDKSSIRNKSKYDVYVDNKSKCDSPIMGKLRHKKIKDVTNIDLMALVHQRKGARKKITFEEDKGAKPELEVPSTVEQARFKKDLDHAASMVFHSRTGLPLTSSPAPVRRGKSCFDFDSTINSVSAIKSALFPASFSTDDESESDGSIVSPCSPDVCAVLKRELTPVKYRRKGHAANLLGSFEESVLNGRLEPVSTVHGFTAELGASGSFVPKHLIVPVTVFFYTLGDNDKVSSPYLSHINLGKKGYNVPKSGTVQVTLFNPLGTVVKMFVIMYDLSDMPPNSQTFLRQRTLYMPTNCREENAEWGPKWLRYLIHLRFLSSKSGKIYLHSDIRMIIFRKSDMDTATAHGIDMSYELRSFTHTPVNPRFSPRK